MQTQQPLNPDRLAVFDLLTTPVWIFDIDHSRMWWANRVAVALWDAPNLAELLDRDMASDMTAAVRLRLRHYLLEFRQGRSLVENWTLFPKGRPVTVNCTCSGVPLDDTRLGMLVEGHVARSFDTDVLRSVEALRHTPLMTSLYDRDGILLCGNPAARESLPGERTFLGHFVDPEDGLAVLKGLETSDHCQIEAQVRTCNGPRWHELTVSHSLDPATGRPMLVVGKQDIGDRRRTEEALQRSRADLERQVARRTQELIRVNRALVHSNTALTEEIQQRRQAEEALRRSQEVLEARVAERTRELARLVARLNQEVEERRAIEARIRRLAHHDGLTDLPNRSLLLERLEQAIDRARQRDDERVAVLFIDLDRFKVINDTLGHRVGDLLLQEVAVRLQGCVRRKDTVARLGGDEFVIVLPELKDDGPARRVAQEIGRCLSRPLVIEGSRLQIGASIGIGLYPDDGGDVTTLMQSADTAMYRAKHMDRSVGEAGGVVLDFPPRRHCSV